MKILTYVKDAFSWPGLFPDLQLFSFHVLESSFVENDSHYALLTKHRKKTNSDSTTYAQFYYNDWLTNWLVDWLVDWLFYWLIEWVIGWLINKLIDWLIEWAVFEWLNFRVVRWLRSLSSIITAMFIQMTFWWFIIILGFIRLHKSLVITNTINVLLLK